MGKTKYTYTVPDKLKGQTVWTTAPSFKRNVKRQGCFVLDNCSQRELKYLHSKGIGILRKEQKGTDED